MFRYQGLIDFACLVDGFADVPVTAAENGLRRVALPGLTLKWNADAAEIAGNDGVIALVAGRVLPSTRSRAEAARWIERYARDGARAPSDVGGAFAGVIVDVRKRLALLFVDRFSIETLCYRSSNGTLGFSDAACDVPGSSGALDPQSVYDYLYFHVIPAPQTVFADVRRVEAAHSVKVSMSGEQSVRYWEPVFVESDRRDLSGRLEGFTKIVRESVAEEAEGPSTACFLSGGTDSSTVAGMLSRMRDEPVHAYSIGFEAEGYDEMAYARIAARHFRLVHHEYYVTPQDLVQAIPTMASAFDQPFGNSSVLPAYLCALRARESGFDRMLAGDGGDELFAGNSRYALQQLLQLYSALPRAVRHRVLEPAASGWALFRRVPIFKQIGGYVRHSSVPMPERLDTFKLLPRLGEETMLEADFRARVDSQRPLTQQRETWRAANAGSLLNRMLAYDWKYTLADSDLPKVRSATQLAGVSVGYPLLSRALTDFSLMLPPEWKLRKLRLRWFFKQALRGFLPSEILRKKKHGFGLPFGPWLVRHAELRRLVEDSLDGISSRGIVRRQFTVELLDKHVPQSPGYYGEMVWLLMMLEQWLRAHEAKPFSEVLERAAPRAASASGATGRSND